MSNSWHHILFEWCCQHWDDSGTLLVHTILATQKSELVKYLKATSSPHVRRLHAHNFTISKTRSLLNWLFSDLDSSSWQLNLSNGQNDFSSFQPGWWQFCWITGVKFNSIQSIVVLLLHITQLPVCATKNLTVFVPDSPRCLEYLTMAAISRSLRELSTRRTFFIEIQWQGIILALMYLC